MHSHHYPFHIHCRYFVSYISQFQFYKSMCAAAGHTGPLYKCDFDGNLAAGQLMGDMLELGSAYPWPVPMFVMTGE